MLWVLLKGAETAPRSSRADVRERATNGSGKAVPKGTFNRPRKRAVRGLGLAPTSVSEWPKGYPETLLASSVAIFTYAGTAERHT